MIDESALTPRPGVSYVMPVLNEAEHVEAAVASLFAQDYDGPTDVTLALGPSSDGTTEIVEALAATHSRIRLVPNESGSIPVGMNRAIRASEHPIVIRVDAHSVLGPDYTRIAVETMQRTGADNVGGVMDAQGVTAFERAVASAYGTRLGLGGTRLHTGGHEGPAETVYLGVFRRSSLEAVGGYDETIKRGEDWDLNRRLRSHGFVVWFTPALRVLYRPRRRLKDLAMQFVATGVWRGELARRFPSANGLRYFAPPALLAVLTLGVLLGLAGVVQALVGAAPWLLLGFVAPAAYALGVLVAAPVATRGHGVSTTVWFLAVLPCIHVCWGAGFVFRLLRIARDLDTYTGR